MNVLIPDIVHSQLGQTVQTSEDALTAAMSASCWTGRTPAGRSECIKDGLRFHVSLCHPPTALARST